MEKGARLWFGAGAGWIALGVVLDTWHAHGLSQSLTAERSAAFASALEQHYHVGFGLLAGALWLNAAGQGQPRLRRALILFSAVGLAFGALLFSGSIYLRELSGIESVVRAAPYGGSLQILAWLALAGSAFVKASGRRSGAGTQI